MLAVLRIQERYNVPDKGMAYMVRFDKDAIPQVGDLFFDLRGNRFKVKGILAQSKYMMEIYFERMMVALLFESIDGVDVSGNMLVSKWNKINFLFCSHPLYPRKSDMDYEEEYQVAGENHKCALFSYEDLEDRKLSLHGDEIIGLTIYRGWMMDAYMYQTLYSLLEENGIILVNSPEEYERYHMLPGWYEDFMDKTPKSIWEYNGDVDYILEMSENFEGSYIVKDYVKSRKHEWYEACYIPDIADKENAKKIINTFVSRQGEALAGGIVLRKFENLKQIGLHEKSGMPISEEYRVFVYAGKVHIVDNYWKGDLKVELSKEELAWIIEIAAEVKSNFVTVDLARKEDGTLIVMELGDGQVSGLQEIGEKEFYSRFCYIQEDGYDEFG